MQKLFTKATVYAVSLPLAGGDSDAADFVDTRIASDELRFKECLPSHLISAGFEPYPKSDPFDTTDVMVDRFPGAFAFQYRIDEKKIPAPEIKKRQSAILARTYAPGQPVPKEAKQAAKDDAVVELAHQAFAQTRIIEALYVPRSGGDGPAYLFVPTTSDKDAGRVTAALIHAMGTLKTQTIHVSNLSDGLTNRLQALVERSQALAGGYGVFGRGPFGRFETPAGVILKRPGTSDRLTFEVMNRSEMDAAIADAINNEYRVKALDMLFDDIAFRLRDDFKLTRISSLLELDGEEEDVVEGQRELVAGDIRMLVAALDELCSVFGFDPSEGTGEDENAPGGDLGAVDGVSGPAPAGDPA